MAVNWLRRGFLAAACASAALLAACGSSTIESALSPSRIIVFGDGMADVGQNGSRYTVNDASLNVWTAQLAGRYDLTLTAASAGGTGYARGNARIAAKPDAAGNAATLTMAEQIDAFRAAGGVFGDSDLVVLNGGVADVVAEMAAVNAGTETSDQMLANLKQAGRDLGAQAQRLVAAGAQHVFVVGSIDLGRTPWGTAIDKRSLLTNASLEFNNAFLISVVGMGKNVFYVDSAYYFNLMTGSPGSYAFDTSETPVCTSVDPGNGIGIGAGEVNSALCNASTLLPGVTDYSKYVYADKIYPTPAAHRQFGDWAYDRLRTQW
ncbi:SGNH/GDSL hydrolase family protein [Ramlibacter sp. H39-3-26]|uniref:SGNH/GDSL hydrolase family protein n=1 Tax=Curvibacter soli TaxID=3031331 RepID=UPI0023DB41C6|nr:SGNH/GDSL hydrolase family protein [Ramlibacter sp. H39-3-26]MDF1484602.1 SGNH/GDSL hydrolase family protein [Ramlibacter sp. H39-3-26]